MHFQRCLVALTGEPEDLQALSALQGYNWRIVDDNGTYYLTSGVLDMSRDPDDALQVAREIVPVINGAAQIYLTNFQPIRLAGSATILRTDGTRQTAQTAQTITGMSRIRLSVCGADVKNAPPLDVWMGLASQDAQVAKAFNLWGSLEHNWRNLYLVLEVIEDTTGGPKTLLAQGWLPDKAGIELFKHTANNWFALGPDARHATERWKPPEKPMTLPDAEKLIRRTLQRWLQQRFSPLL